jgi:queuosine precursor transporter
MHEAMIEHITEQAGSRRQWFFIVLTGILITSAVTAELISNKLVQVPVHFRLFDHDFGPYVTIVGILPWPVVFLVTDLMNEFYGHKAVRRVSWISAGLIGYCFLIVSGALALPAQEIPGSGVATDAEFHKVFGQSQSVILGSLTAFILSQLLDATLFQWIKNRTGNRLIWLRSTGSTVVSQLFDSYVVMYIGFVVPGTIPIGSFWGIAFNNYTLKLLIAILLTPMIYAGHYSIRKYLHPASVAEK